MSGVITGEPKTRTVRIDSDLSDKEGFAVDLDATDQDVVNLTADAATIPYPLIEGEDGSTDEGIGTIAIGGVVKVKAGGAIAPNDKLTATTGGKWIATTTDTNHFGAIALEVGATDDLIKVLVVQGMVAG